MFADWTTTPSLSLDFTLNATPALEHSLNGQWEVAMDPENRGKGERWFEQSSVRGAQTAEIPNPIQLTFPGYNGVIWYWQSFDAGTLANYDDVRIHFGGTDYFAEAWLNGTYLGGNESALLPFAFPIKQALRSGTNRLVVRVIDACYAKEIDGFQLGHVPGGRQADDPLEPGFRHFNYGGLLLPVTLQAFRRPWIADGFIRPDIHQEKVDIDLILVGDGHPSEWDAEVQPIYPQSSGPVAQKKFQITPDAEGRATISISVPNPRLWKIWDPFLYQVTLSPSGNHTAGTTWKARFGMRTVSIVDHRMAVNEEPFLQRSFLYNQIWPVTLGVPNKDMARQDIELVRSMNANMLRCFSKTPLPATAEAADEAGILLQHESLASWFLVRGQKERARLKNITERGVLLLRNHPSLFWWNVLNENSPYEDLRNEWLAGPYVMTEVLPSIHRLDPTRPAICDDPIWNEVPNIWEPGHSEPSLPLSQNHYYPFTALENHEESWHNIRGRAWGEKPGTDTPFVAITEWGQNSSPEWDRLMQSYRTSGVRQDAEDYVVYRKLHAMNQGWYEQSGIAKRGFPTLASVEKANRESVAERYRECFALFWGNTHCVGQGMTSLEDSSYEMSGVVDNWRNPKPVVFEALTKLNEPLQLNLWLRPASVYANAAITFDATLVNEGQRLPAGEYPLELRLVDSRNQTILSRQYHHSVGKELIEFLMVESLPLPVRPGLYELHLELSGSQTSLLAKRPVHVFAKQPKSLDIRPTVWVWEKGDRLQKWLQQRGVSARVGDISPTIEPDDGPSVAPHLAQVQPGDLLIVDEMPNPEEIMPRIHAAVQQGAHAIVLRPVAVFGGDKPVALLNNPLEFSYSPLMGPVIGNSPTIPDYPGWKPVLKAISWWGSPGAWGYSRTALALQHPFLEGLPQAVALEAQPAYQRVAPRYTWDITGAPELAEVDSAVVENALNVDGPYTADLFSVTSGEGRMVLNTLHLAENLDTDPASDRILENILLVLAKD
ncbi:MAG TPA: hypothetical protein VHX63_13455 [Acidobacteriaceae bacterium]|nr:hypothetical protein [Acidobacteriaceae bacterium]